MDEKAIRYLVISPMKDEAAHLPETLRTVTAQTILPACWVLVDDGSRDASCRLAARYAVAFEWIRLLQSGSGGARLPGSGVIRAFARGLEGMHLKDFDFIVKLDCDLALPPDYFEQLFARFARDPQLGIASGAYAEQSQNGWKAVKMPAYHAAGASKVLRRECFEQIGGFVAEKGWDTVDEVRAQALGWRTTHFPELIFHHLKPEGVGVGQLRTSVMHGEIFERTAGSFPLALLKAARRLLSGRPPVLGAAAMLWGCLRTRWRHMPSLLTAEEQHCYRRLLYGRLCRFLAFTHFPRVRPLRGTERSL